MCFVLLLESFWQVSRFQEAHLSRVLGNFLTLGNLGLTQISSYITPGTSECPKLHRGRKRGQAPCWLCWGLLLELPKGFKRLIGGLAKDAFYVNKLPDRLVGGCSSWLDGVWSVG